LIDEPPWPFLMTPAQHRQWARIVRKRGQYLGTVRAADQKAAEAAAIKTFDLDESWDAHEDKRIGYLTREASALYLQGVSSATMEPWVQQSSGVPDPSL
jgi:hypothetical protein